MGQCIWERLKMSGSSGLRFWALCLTSSTPTLAGSMCMRRRSTQPHSLWAADVVSLFHDSVCLWRLPSLVLGTVKDAGGGEQHNDGEIVLALSFQPGASLVQETRI